MLQRKERPWTSRETLEAFMTLTGMVIVPVVFITQLIRQGVSVTDCMAAAFLFLVASGLAFRRLWEHG
jgi:hypothetical protein